MASDTAGRDIGDIGANFERQLLAAVVPSAGKLGGEINQLAGVVGGIINQLGSLSGALSNFTNVVNGNVSKGKALNDEIGKGRSKVSADTKAVDIPKPSAGASGGGGDAGAGPKFDDVGIKNYVKGLGQGKALLRDQIIDLAKAGSINDQQLLTIQQSVFWQGRYSKAHQRTKSLLEDQVVLMGSQLQSLQMITGEEAKSASHKEKLKQAQDNVNAAAKKYTDHLTLANKKAATHNRHWKNTAKSISESGKKALRLADSIVGTITGKSISEELNLKGAIRNQFEWNKEITNTRFLQGESGELAQDALQSMKIRLSTGQDVTTATKAYNKVFQKGMKNEKKALKVTKEGLRTATLIGANAEATVEFTQQMTMEFGLANLQMSAMSREMQATATSTGLIGDELLNAVKSSEKFMKNLRASGTFTTEAAGNLMRMTAEAKKLGAGDTMGRIQDLMSGKILDAKDDPLANLLYQAAANVEGNEDLMLKLMSGQALGSKDNRQMFESTQQKYESVITQQTDGRAKTLKDIQKTIATGTKEQKTQALQDLIAVQRGIKGAFGVEVGELDVTLKAWKESTLTFTERWKKLKDKESKTEIKNLSEKERLNRELQMSSTKFHEASNLLGKAEIDTGDFTAFIEATQGEGAAKDLGDMSQKDKRSMLTKDLFKTAQAAQVKVDEGGGVIKEMLTDETMQDALSENSDVRDAALEKIQDAMAQANVAQKEMQNPVNRIERDVARIKEFLQFTWGGIFGTIAGYLLDALDWLGGLFGWVEKIYNWFAGKKKQVKNTAKGALGGAAAGAVLGSVVPGIGTVAGGIVGGVIGGITGWFSKVPKAQKGGFVKEGGLIDVHQGEIITPKENLAKSCCGGGEGKGKGATGVGGGGFFSKLIKSISSSPIFSSIFGRAADDKGEGSGIVGMLSKVFNDSPLLSGIVGGGEKGGGIIGGMDKAVGSHPIFGPIMEMFSPTTTPTANIPRSGTRHIESAMREDRAGGSPDAPGSRLAQDMSGVEGNTSQTVQELQRLQEKLDKLLAVFSETGPNGSDGHPDAGDPRANKKPRGNANYYTWQMSRYTSNASKGPVSDPAF